MKIFEPISREERKEIEDGMVAAVKEQFQKEKIEGKYYQYDVDLKNIQFRTYMTHKELKQAASYAVDILEELKAINNNGVNRAKFEEIKEEVSKKIKGNYEGLIPLLQANGVMNQISTEKLEELVSKIADLRRVGGAYWMLMSHPHLKHALVNVYDVIVDCFDVVEECSWYDISAFFLMRAIMRVRSEEIDEKE